MRRRHFLATTAGLAVATSVSGCADGSDSERRTEIDVMNVTDESLRVDLAVLSDEEVLFEKRYEVGAGKGDSSASVRGEPTDVHVDVLGGIAERFDFRSHVDCERADDEPKIVVTIWAIDDVGLTNGCAW